MRDVQRLGLLLPIPAMVARPPPWLTMAMGARMEAAAGINGKYRVLRQVATDLSTEEFPKWKVDAVTDRSHPHEALEMARRWQAAHIDAIEHQRARVLVELIGGG